MGLKEIICPHVLFGDWHDLHISDEVICGCDMTATVVFVDAGGTCGCDDLGAEGVVGEGGALMGMDELGIEFKGTGNYTS